MEKRRSEETQKVQATEVQPVDQALEGATEMVEGKVTEIAKTAVAEDGGGGGGQIQDDDQTQQKQDDGVKDDRALLREKLLKSAPKEGRMKNEIERTLVKRKAKLEHQIKKHRRKKNYHMLTLAIMQLRIVVHQLEELAKASYEKLKDMWLSVVHRLA